MTLKEKFKQIDIKLSENHSTKIVEVEAEIMEKIADEYAIGFAEWLLVNDTPENAKQWFGLTYKDMLNAYKKEKGL
jgi:hypothetical protein